MSRRDETPRDLLFGLLALQVGLIDQDRLVAAFGAWSRARGKALAEILVDSGSIDAESRSIIEAMARKQLELHGGDVEKSLASVSVGPSTRRKLSTAPVDDLGGPLGLVGSTVEEDDPYRTASRGLGTSSPGGGRFRILRPHAEGGLGAVFVALDGELNREVALKEMLDRHADDPGRRARFLVEAEITGGLEHPGIVPVYGLGRYEDGRPYYAMRFIRGDTLREAIAAFRGDPAAAREPGRRSLALRELLGRFVDVCNAVDYAHGRGILHRDLKPGNIIVGKHGETLVVDWGLAKPTGHSEAAGTSGERTLTPSPGGSAETLPGSAIGTPAYMSPEQARGDLDHLGPRSDVYSLGATLYCLLTGRAPFDGSDVGAVLRDVEKGAFPAPRSVDPAVDRALEAVCLKAMATRPEDRHATARALADDVERWAADEPVSAWREPAAVRARRWMRRNRTAVTAASAALVMAVLGLAGVLAVQSRANARLEAGNIELAKANAREASANAELREANGRVQARFDLAREAIRSFQQGVGEDDMLKGRELKGLRDKLLRSAAGFYEKLEQLLRGQADRTSRAALAQSYSELGNLTGSIGTRAEALAVHRKALAIRRDLAASPDVGAKLDLARSLVAVASLAGDTGDIPGALASYEEALGLAGSIARGGGATAESRDRLVSCLTAFGSLMARTGKAPEAMKTFGEALAVGRKLVDDHPDLPEYRDRLASVHSVVGKHQWDSGKPAEGIAMTREVLADRRKVAAAQPGLAEHRRLLANDLANLGFMLSKSGKWDEAFGLYRESLAIRRKLVDEQPAVTDFRNNLAEFLNKFAYMQLQTGHPDDALASCREALEIQRRLAVENPAVTDFRQQLSGSYYNIGTLEMDNAHPAEAMASYSESLAIQGKLAADNPGDTQFLGDLGDCHHALGNLLSRIGRAAEALASYREALTIQRKLADANPDDTSTRSGLGLTLTNIGLRQWQVGLPAEALASSREAVAVFDGLAAANPDNTELLGRLAYGHLGLGRLLAQAGHPAEALRSLREALAIQQKLSDGNRSVDSFLGDLAYNRACIGLRLFASGDPAGALAEHDAARAILQPAYDANAAAPDYQGFLAVCRTGSADAHRVLGRLDAARADYDRAVAIRERLVRENPVDIFFSGHLADGVRRRGLARLAAGDRAGAAADARRALALDEALPARSGAEMYEVACARSSLSGLAGLDGSGIPASERGPEADRAVDALRIAIGMGYRDSGSMLREAGLDPLRSRPDFRALMMDLAWPDPPFAD